MLPYWVVHCWWADKIKYEVHQDKFIYILSKCYNGSVHEFKAIEVLIFKKSLYRYKIRKLCGSLSSPQFAAIFRWIKCDPSTIETDVILTSSIVSNLTINSAFKYYFLTKWKRIGRAPCSRLLCWFHSNWRRCTGSYFDKSLRWLHGSCSCDFVTQSTRSQSDANHRAVEIQAIP